MLHADGVAQITLIVGASLLQTGILLVALINRDQRGPANVGVDSILMLAINLGLCMLHVAMWLGKRARALPSTPVEVQPRRNAMSKQDEYVARMKK